MIKLELVQQEPIFDSVHKNILLLSADETLLVFKQCFSVQRRVCVMWSLLGKKSESLLHLWPLFCSEQCIILRARLPPNLKRIWKLCSSKCCQVLRLESCVSTLVGVLDLSWDEHWNVSLSSHLFPLASKSCLRNCHIFSQRESK